MAKQIIGHGQNVGGCHVEVREIVLSNGDREVEETELDPRFDEIEHSPDGFQWGYSGSGPAQLAYAILREFYDEETARDYYQDFKHEVVAGFEGSEDFVLDKARVTEWMEAQ